MECQGSGKPTADCEEVGVDSLLGVVDLDETTKT